MKGIIPDYFRKIADYAGISYEFLTPATRDEYIAYQKNKEATDMSIDARLEIDNYAETKKWGLTAPFITMQLARVTRREFDGEINVVTVWVLLIFGWLLTTMAVIAMRLSARKKAQKVAQEKAEEMAELAEHARAANKAKTTFLSHMSHDFGIYRNKKYVVSVGDIIDEKNNFMNKIIKLKGSILAGIIQIFACLIVYKFNIPNPNIVLFVVLSASIVQSGYLAGIISGVIAVLYSAFFFSTDHSWIFYTPINRDKLCVIVLGVISNIILVGNLQEANRQAEHKIAKLESEKKQKKKELEQQDELHKALIAADTANRAKSTFLLNMSHDIRTPLNGIMGLLKINMAHSDDEELVRENYKEMEKAANHLLSLINDVLQMSKLEDGREELSSELVCLPDVFYDMKAIIDGSALDKGISVDFSEDSIWVHPYVITNPLYLRQIFLNIYGNSIKFTNFGGKISTKQECIEEKDNVITYRWIISDTGIGMSKEFLKHIFEPFAQERADARSNYHGTGLGMAIVKKMIDKMGGTISVTSEVGKGSTFVVELPFEMGAAPEKSKKEEADKENSIHGLNLMLVEDNELNAEVAEILLEDEGAIITMVNDGQQAVELFNNNPVGTFDAILMDIMMPVMDGLTATKAIRALNRADAGIIPIIAMTANAFAEDVQRCLDAGMNAHLAKPLDIEKVKKTICEHTIEIRLPQSHWL